MRFKYSYLLISLAMCIGCSLPVIAFSEEEKVALLGDSMTWIGGDDCEKSTGWSYYLKETFPKSQISIYARSGATWTNTAQTKGDVNAYSDVLDNENVLYNQVRRLINDTAAHPEKTPTVIIVYAGANDAWFQKQRPGIFSDITVPEGSVEDCLPSSYTSLASSIELDCRLLQEHFPDARLLLVTPVEMAPVTPDKVKRVGDVIEEIGKKQGIEVLRADKNVNIRHAVERIKPRRYTYDGVHTNPAGARLIANYIIDKLKYPQKQE